MTNKISKAFIHEGQKYELKYTMQSLCDLEDTTGKTSGEIFSSVQNDEKFSANDLCSLFAAGLDHAGVERGVALKIMDAIGMAKAGKLIGEAMSSHMAIGSEEKK